MGEFSAVSQEMPVARHSPLTTVFERDCNEERERAVIKQTLKTCACFVLGICAVLSCSGLAKKVTQAAEVDNTRMGSYRALAQLSFQAFQKGDSATAAELARILERTW